MALDAPIIVWFRDDLRLSDHAAFAAAAESGAPLLCLYVREDAHGDRRPPGGASCWWLAQSLRSLDSSLRQLAQRLVLRQGAAADIVPRLAAEVGASALHFNRRYGPTASAIDAAVAAQLMKRGVAVRISVGNLLQEPEAVRGASGDAPKVFAPFLRRLRAAGDPHAPLKAPRKCGARVSVESDDLDDWKLEPTKPDWASGLRATWTPGEEGAGKTLKAFLRARLDDYAVARDRVDTLGSSRLSPHLHFGEISAAQVSHAVRDHEAQRGKAQASAEKFLAELAWRDFATNVLHREGDIATRNLRDNFDAFPWRKDRKALHAWQRGCTGYPIVDAAMRQLWHEGWMPNRLRMVVASFLVKHLLLDWREGEAWFWDTLVDADPANNPVNWQWVAGSGIDAAPYFRIFNPVLQGEKADPDGDYIKHWLPELAKLPAKHIHAPWALSPIELKSFGVTLGKDYPAPIVDHAAARERALKAFKAMRRG